VATPSAFTKYNFPFASSAIKIIPLLSMPFSFRGARFTKTETSFPIISSGLKCSAIPETMVRFRYQYQLITSTSLSAFGTFSAV
jgi:hypothetical protein